MRFLNELTGNVAEHTYADLMKILEKENFSAYLSFMNRYDSSSVFCKYYSKLGSVLPKPDVIDCGSEVYDRLSDKDQSYPEEALRFEKYTWKDILEHDKKNRKRYKCMIRNSIIPFRNSQDAYRIILFRKHIHWFVVILEKQNGALLRVTIIDTLMEPMHFDAEGLDRDGLRKLYKKRHRKKIEKLLEFYLFDTSFQSKKRERDPLNDISVQEFEPATKKKKVSK
jgi:hypothetical protein